MKSRMPHNPFVYGKVVKGEDFFDRHKESKRLLQLMRGRSNILITGDRRIGKTSLLLKCFSKIKKEGAKVFYFNLDPISSVSHFVERYGSLFTKETSLAKRALQILKSGLKGFRIDVELEDDGSPTASINWQGPGSVKQKAIQEILDLVQALAKKSRSRFIVCFDEFQVARDIEGVDLIAEMRTAFQLHDAVTYIFMGSETHILNQLFSSPYEKFYNSSVKFHIGPIQRDDFGDFIKSKFAERKVTVKNGVVDAIYDWASGIPAHIQHLCACLWDYIDDGCKQLVEGHIQKAVQEEVTANDQLYLQIWKTLSDPKDQAILRRLASAGDLAISSPEFCSSLQMNPTTVTRRLHKIAERARGSIVHQRSGIYVFSDPFFESWVVQRA